MRYANIRTIDVVEGKETMTGYMVDLGNSEGRSDSVFISLDDAMKMVMDWLKPEEGEEEGKGNYR